MPGPGFRTERRAPWAARLRVHGPVLAWTAFIAAALLLPGGDLAPMAKRWPWDLPPGADKVGHCLLFFFETLFLVRSLRYSRPGSSVVILAITTAIVLGALTEALQAFVPYRDGNAGDWIADTLGALAGGAWASHRRHRD